jgi:hypothetical protein
MRERRQGVRGAQPERQDSVADAWKHGRQIRQNAAGRRCIVTGNSVCGDLSGHKTGSDAATNILACLPLKISIEHIDSAGKFRAIVAWRKGLDDE